MAQQSENGRGWVLYLFLFFVVFEKKMWWCVCGALRKNTEKSNFFLVATPIIRTQTTSLPSTFLTIHSFCMILYITKELGSVY